LTLQPYGGQRGGGGDDRRDVSLASADCNSWPGTEVSDDVTAGILAKGGGAVERWPQRMSGSTIGSMLGPGNTHNLGP
jgi:hypothetical protein